MSRIDLFGSKFLDLKPVDSIDNWVKVLLELKARNSPYKFIRISPQDDWYTNECGDDVCGVTVSVEAITDND